MSHSLEREARRLSRALSDFSRAAQRANAGDSEVRQTREALWQSMAGYADAMTELTGWGDPFAGYPPHAETSAGAAKSGEGGAEVRSGSRLGVAVTARYVVRVTDQESLTRAVGLDELCCVAPGDEVGDLSLVTGLFRRDGWDIYEYENGTLGVEPIQMEWTVENTRLT